MRCCFAVVSVLLGSAALSQQLKPEVLLEKLSREAPIEKVYLHLDREKYMAGETIWFSGYLLADFLPDTISTVLYAELVDENAIQVTKKTLPVFFGNTNGQLEIPDSLQEGTYFIRAFTGTMLNHAIDYLFIKKIYVYGAIKKIEQSGAPGLNNQARLEFFPEGGNLVSGVTNTIAFKATFANGVPFFAKGKVKTAGGETITEFSSFHDGMGIFELTPVPGNQYYAEIDNNQQLGKYELPLQTEKGIAVSIIPHPQGNLFEIKQTSKDPGFRVSFMIGQMQNHLVFRQAFAAGRDEIQGIINTQHLKSGILQITFFNEMGIPLAERLCFVNNKEFSQSAILIPDSVNFSPKARNKLNIQLKDTVQGSLSVSIVDADFDNPELNDNTIISHFLLVADLKGYIHNPAYYFSADADSVTMALDLLMMTHGWRRFKWTDLADGRIPGGNIKDPSYITLSGKVTLRDSKKPFASKQLLVWITGEDSSRSMHAVMTDEQGNYKLDSVVFFGKAKVLFSDTRGKKSQYIEIHPDSSLLIQDFILPETDLSYWGKIDSSALKQKSKWVLDYNEIQKAEGMMLRMVTVKALKKSKEREIDEKYTSGMFSGMSEKSIDLTASEDIITQQNILDYLALKIPSISVSDLDGEYAVFYRQSPTLSSLGSIPMTIFLDEIVTDANVIAAIPANTIALVKLYSSFVGASGNAPGGALAIYTKKGADISYNFRGGVIHYNGFSITREFYAPDYGLEKNKLATMDKRITLDWWPSVLFKGINPSIPIVFYNNDRTKKFKVVVQGMTSEGKMIYIEKGISAD